MTTTWVPEIARRPVAFAQVREDPLLDCCVVQQLGDKLDVLMIASGGCTATVLAALPQIRRLHLVDANPAQIALSRLKLRLLATTSPAERLALLGHVPLPPIERQNRIAHELNTLELGPNVLGPLEFVGEIGPDHAGRYEGLFAELRAALDPLADQLSALLQLRDPVEQSRRVDPETSLGHALDTAFDAVMALPNLIGLFGEGATKNRYEPFSRHFAHRTRHALATLPAADNPYLWQMLLGRFPEKVAYPWFNEPTPGRVPEVTWTVSMMAETLRCHSGAFDLVHLSNILDWLSPEEAHATLESAWRALRPRGIAVIRQLNSTLNVPALESRFDWDTRFADTLHNRDRSFFYRKFHLGRKR